MLRHYLTSSIRLRSSRVLHRLQSGYGGPGSSLEYYSLLGVKRDATQREIKAAYYQLSKKYHPDVAGKSPSAATKFLQISEAYECLKDPDRRRAYDNQATGGGGRYTGDTNDPFRDFNNRDRAWNRQNGNHGNPFHNRQFTQQEYQRIWEEFNRLRNERHTYDSRMEWERQRAWAEFARQRAQRWTEFHNKYPNGPPGSVKWEFRFRNQNQEGINAGWQLFRKIMMVYFVCFFVISIVRVSLQELGSIGSSNQSKQQKMKNVDPLQDDIIPQRSDRDKVQHMMNRVPHSSSSSTHPELSYMNRPPIAHPQSPQSQVHDQYSTTDDSGFTMYRPQQEERSYR